MRIRQAPPATACTFGAVLQHYRLYAGLSQIEVGRRAGMGAGYVNRLESGDRSEPSRDTTHALVCGLGLHVADADRLYLAAGHVPPSWQKLGHNDTTLAALVAVLTNDALHGETKADLRACIETMCAHWTGTAGRVGGPERGN